MRKYILIIKLATLGIFSNKVRAFLTMLGIIIGVSSVIAIISIGAGAQSLITNSIKTIGTNTISILPGASDESGPPASAYGIVITTLTNDDALAIKKIPHVTAVGSYVQGNTEISHQGRSVIGAYSGVSASYPDLENHDILEGRFFTEQENGSASKVAVLGSELKEELFPLSDPIGKKIKVQNTTFKVIGVLETKGTSLMRNFDNQVIMPLNTAQKIMLGISYVSLIRVKIDSEDNVDITKDRIVKELKYRHDIAVASNEDFSVRALSQALDTFNSITLALKFFLAAIAAVSLIVGGIGITNIMLMSVKERTREIGLRKAIGATTSNIKNQFLIEALVLTTLGGIIGIIFGVLLSFVAYMVISYLGYDWTFDVPMYSVFISIIVSMGIGLIFGTYPAKRAAMLRPIEALRYE